VDVEGIIGREDVLVDCVTVVVNGVADVVVVEAVVVKLVLRDVHGHDRRHVG
jgi:hypothetical protein